MPALCDWQVHAVIDGLAPQRGLEKEGLAPRPRQHRKAETKKGGHCYRANVKKKGGHCYKANTPGGKAAQEALGLYRAFPRHLLLKMPPRLVKEWCKALDEDGELEDGNAAPAREVALLKAAAQAYLDALPDELGFAEESSSMVPGSPASASAAALRPEERGALKKRRELEPEELRLLISAMNLNAVVSFFFSKFESRFLSRHH